MHNPWLLIFSCLFACLFPNHAGAAIANTGPHALLGSYWHPGIFPWHLINNTHTYSRSAPHLSSCHSFLSLSPHISVNSIFRSYPNLPPQLPPSPKPVTSSGLQKPDWLLAAGATQICFPTEPKPSQGCLSHLAQNSNSLSGSNRLSRTWPSSVPLAHWAPAPLGKPAPTPGTTFPWSLRSNFLPVVWMVPLTAAPHKGLSDQTHHGNHLITLHHSAWSNDLRGVC